MTIGTHQVVHAHQTVVFGEFVEKFDHNVFWNCMRVQHNAMGILYILSVLESTAVKTNLLAHLCNSIAVEVSEKIELEDSFGNLWCRHQVDFEEFSLK